MSIETYGQLKTAVADYSKRSDLTAKIPDFIRLAEQDTNRRMVTSFDLTSRPDGATNWLLENAADVYLFGALTHLSLYTRDNEEAVKYASLYAQAVDTAHWSYLQENGLLDEKLKTEYPLGETYWWDISNGT